MKIEATEKQIEDTVHITYIFYRDEGFPKDEESLKKFFQIVIHEGFSLSSEEYMENNLGDSKYQNLLDVSKIFYDNFSPKDFPSDEEGIKNVFKDCFRFAINELVFD